MGTPRFKETLELVLLKICFAEVDGQDMLPVIDIHEYFLPVSTDKSVVNMIA